MKQLQPTKNRSAGFTILEMIIVFGVFGVALVVTTSYFWMSLRVQNKSVKHIVAQDNARRALTAMAGEIRSNMYSDAGSYPIEVAEGQSLIFYTNIDDDVNAERVRYFLDGTDLKRGVIEPSGQPPTYSSVNEQINTLSSYNANGVNDIFTYYDRDYDGTTSPLPSPVNKSKIRLIKINLTIDVDSNTPPDPITVTTEAQLRNLKDNL
ncbi:type II secretion system GspH family protein [Patescibacteria group bacterium]|nr:type II secretion system GspH family protein [Patescibacteria group bacterium]